MCGSMNLASLNILQRMNSVEDLTLDGRKHPELALVFSQIVNAVTCCSVLSLAKQNISDDNQSVALLIDSGQRAKTGDTPSSLMRACHHDKISSNDQ